MWLAPVHWDSCELSLTCHEQSFWAVFPAATSQDPRGENWWWTGIDLACFKKVMIKKVTTKFPFFFLWCQFYIFKIFSCTKKLLQTCSNPGMRLTWALPPFCRWVGKLQDSFQDQQTLGWVQRLRISNMTSAQKPVKNHSNTAWFGCMDPPLGAVSMWVPDWSILTPTCFYHLGLYQTSECREWTRIRRWLGWINSHINNWSTKRKWTKSTQHIPRVSFSQNLFTEVLFATAA